MACPCEHGDEDSGYNSGEFSDQLSNSQLLKTTAARGVSSFKCRVFMREQYEFESFESCDATGNERYVDTHSCAFCDSKC
jgi:hypothetical protein